MKLKRYPKNPILKPIKEHPWESLAVYNCGVIKNGKTIHMLYRAVGQDKISRFGYAKSKDGINFVRHPKPVFELFPKPEFSPKSKYEFRGVEDPRVTKLKNKYYITYSVFAPGWTTSKSYLAVSKNFKKFEEKGVISPEIEDSRNVVLFPEKVRDKFILYHRIVPNIWIAYSKDLKKWTGHKIIMKPRRKQWDCFKIGPAGPPLKTESGWLLIYHGVNEKLVYRLGVALFDLKNPAKLIARQKEPILEPEKPWEKKGIVPNVVFSCGAIEMKNKYYIYYGGADKVICLATVNKDKVFDFL